MAEESHLADEDGSPWEEDAAEAGVRWRQLVSADRTPSRGLSVGVFEVRPGAELAPHHHAPQEVYYVVEGRAEICRDGAWGSLERGDIAYIPGGAVHGVRNRGEETIVIVWVFPTETYDEIEYFDA
jgi:quercetin dioxygenase-like cupin family protein